MRLPLLLLLFARLAIAQAVTPAFDVATIKRSPELIQWSGFQLPGGGRFEASHVTVRGMVAFAYDVPDFRVSGGAGWAGSDRFEIVAKAPDTATPAQMRAMLQALLAERFNLTVRRETKEASQYQLVIAKDGPKLRESSGQGGFIRFLGAGQIQAQGIAAAGLANYLQTLFGQAVTDRTGLTAKYDFSLTWTPDESQAGKAGAVAIANSAELSGPSIFTALKEQLGLKVESTKGPAETMVIERVEKPTDN